MLSVIVRLIFLGICIFVIIYLNKRTRIIKKKKTYKILIFILFILCTISFYIPIENSFIVFTSLESAFRYTNFSTIKFVIEGKNSDMVICDDENNSTHFIPKTSKGWKMESGNKLLRFRNYETISMSVYQDKYSGDCYIIILDMTNKIFEVYDNQNSIFYYDTLSYNDNENTHYDYYSYAYIDDFNEQYTLTVNGEEIVLEQCEGVK